MSTFAATTCMSLAVPAAMRVKAVDRGMTWAITAASPLSSTPTQSPVTG